MKRYLLFIYENYYPRGGFFDFSGSFDCPEEASSLGRSAKGSDLYSGTEWFVIDTDGMETVVGSDKPTIK